MELFNAIVGKLVGWLWGPWLTVTLVGIGIYFTFGCKFIQVGKIGFILKETFGKMFVRKADIDGEGSLTPFQAAATALASTVGVGSIVGIGTALALGGPGSMFWMFVAAFFGMCTKYGEIVLAILYREKKSDGSFQGGPAYYMKNGLNSKFLAGFYAVALALTCLGSNMVQANAAAASVNSATGLPNLAIGLVLAGAIALALLGGVTRLGEFVEKLIPIMSGLYLVGGLVVILLNISELPGAIKSIFVYAFAPMPVVGGAVGISVQQAIRFGVARGLYSNEAGCGTAPIAHALAITDHPCRQGMWGVTEVFIDTVVNLLTALVILVTGVIGAGVETGVLTNAAFATVFPAFRYVVDISVLLFAYATIIGLGFYGRSVCIYLFGEKIGSKYLYLYIPFSVLGAVGGLSMVWSIIDVFLALAVIPNIFAIALLSPKVFKASKEFFSGEKVVVENTLSQ
ncbi:MAG TPA: amino acid carrier protein [Clostridia bacterium]|nr:amino acid carrier protein [Clostridia bacterium]